MRREQRLATGPLITSSLDRIKQDSTLKVHLFYNHTSGCFAVVMSADIKMLSLSFRINTLWEAPARSWHHLALQLSWERCPCGDRGSGTATLGSCRLPWLVASKSLSILL